MSDCRRIQSWPLTIDFNHVQIRSVVKHLTQLEKHDGIDLGTSIEIQNRLNQLARFQPNPSPQFQLLLDRITHNHGKKFPSDRAAFQSIQAIRLILDDLVYAIELNIFVGKHRIPRHFHHRIRHFLHRIFQNELSLDQLTQYHQQLKHVYHIRHLNIEELKRFIFLLSKESNQLYPLTLTDQLLDQLKWDGKTVEDSMRDQLLKVWNDTFLIDC